MSLAWYVVLERETPGFQTFINGKALSQASELLDSIAQEMGVLPLSRFFSISPAALTEFAADHSVDFKQLAKVPSENWFLPQEGLKTLRALLEAALRGKISENVVQDLKDFQQVLQTAEANGVRWHLAIDF